MSILCTRATHDDRKVVFMITAAVSLRKRCYLRSCLFFSVNTVTQSYAAHCARTAANHGNWAGVMDQVVTVCVHAAFSIVPGGAPGWRNRADRSRL